MKKFANLYLALVFVILYIPFFYLIFYSFNQGGDMNGFTGLTLEHYSEMFADSRLMLILIQTFFLAFLSSILATAIGTLEQFTFTNHVRNVNQSILSLNNILMVAPDVMIGASFLILFTRLADIFHFNLGFMTVLLSHIAFSIRIVVLMVLPRLKEMNDDMINAAYDLGSNSMANAERSDAAIFDAWNYFRFFMAFTYSLMILR